jgi:phage terminase small subunit
MKKPAENLETALLEPPPYLSARSQALWRQYAGPVLKSPGQFTLLETGLAALDRADQAREIIAREGLTIENAKAKIPHQHPALNILKEAEAMTFKIFKALFLNCPGKWGSSF